MPCVFSLCVSAFTCRYGWGDGVVVVVLVVLVRGALSGVGSASALRLSIGSEADSWWTGFGALWFCVGAVWELCLRLCVFVLHACIF